MTQTSRVVIHCPTCDSPYNYDFSTQPRRWCKICKKQFRFESQLAETSLASQKGSGGHNSSSISPPTPDLLPFIEMEDTDLIRHTARLIACHQEATFRDRLDAIGKLMALKDKQGTLDTKSESEKEVYDRFNQQPTVKLVGLLRKSSQIEH